MKLKDERSQHLQEEGFQKISTKFEAKNGLNHLESKFNKSLFSNKIN